MNILVVGGAVESIKPGSQGQKGCGDLFKIMKISYLNVCL